MFQLGDIAAATAAVGAGTATEQGKGTFLLLSTEDDQNTLHTYMSNT